MGQAKRFAQDIAAGVKRAGSLSKQLALEGMRAEIERMAPLIRQVMKQTGARIFAATPAAKARSSACSNRQRKSSAKAKPASRPSSVRW